MEKKKITENEWLKAVNESKIALDKTKFHQMLIADNALAVCEITWGGRQYGKNCNMDERYTVTRFAKEIGVRMSTLSNWISIKLKIFNKLSAKQKQTALFTDMCFVAERVGRTAPITVVQKAFDKYTSEDTYQRKMAFYIKYVRVLADHFQKKAAAYRVDDDILNETLFYSTKIIEAIKRDKPKIKGTSGTEGAYKRFSIEKRGSSAATLLGGTKKDKRKQNYLGG